MSQQSEGRSSSHDEARLQAQKQWNAAPCGALDDSVENQEYFQRVETERYRQQYWQQAWMGYDRFAGKDVLEIGIGLGTDLKQFARAGARCTGVDITQRHLELTGRNFAGEGYPVHLFDADATALPFPDETFDCIHSFGVLHHIPDVERVLAEARRVLRPGGILLTGVYHKHSIAAASLFVRAILNGKLRRIGSDGVLATIEVGADGVSTKPYVRLYSKSGWGRTLAAAGFTNRRLTARQIFSHVFGFVNRMRPIQSALGWYVVAESVKPGASPVVPPVSS